MTPLSTIGLPEIIAGIMLAALNAYVLTGGADFGGGVWDLLASGRSRDEQRSLIERSIAPIWEANHVWLILIVTLLFTCFPKAFAAISIALHIPLTLMLIGIVMRGALDFRIGAADVEERVVLKAGEVYLAPREVWHGDSVFIGDEEYGECWILDVFAPPRDDLRAEG